MISEIACECSRCLEEYTETVQIALEEKFFDQADVATVATIVSPASPEENSTYIDRRHVVDLGEAVKQYCALSLPINPCVVK